MALSPGPFCPACRYPRVQGGESHSGRVAPLPRCLNPLCPKRPECPKCGSTQAHKILNGGYMLCERPGCKTNFDPRTGVIIP